ncbi:MAG: serine protease, partial [Chloroflexi bacterium]|nr:serine protease [Chloroflexota bacterium]
MQSFGPGRPSAGMPTLDPVRTDPAVSLPPPPAGPAHGDRPIDEPRVVRSRGGTLRVVVPSAVLSAILASGLTVALAGTGGSTPSTASSPTASGGSAAAASSAADATLASVAGAVGVEEVAAVASRSVVTITVAGVAGVPGVAPFGTQPSGVGSGVVVSEDGLILTNAHVVEGGGALTVALPDGGEVAAAVVATDPAHDLAVIRAEATGLTVAVLDEAGDLIVGQAVVAVGSPLGTFTDTVTLGIVSGLDRSIDV